MMKNIEADEKDKDSLRRSERSKSSQEGEREISLETLHSETTINNPQDLGPNDLVDMSLAEKENPSNLTMAIDRLPTSSPMSVSFNLANSSIGAGY
jgi:hypothetical protein